MLEFGAKIGIPLRKKHAMDYKELKAQAEAKQEQLVAIRRELHQIPEFGLDLPKTLAVVLRETEGLGEVTLGKDISAASIVIRGSQPGPTVLLRADMDALQVTEDTGLPFASTNGYMHACGHDLHTTIGIGAAQVLAANKDKIKGNVVMFFQPGEEGHDGAGHMLAQNMHMVSGDKPIAAYGLHVFSFDDAGTFSTRKGSMMASAGDILVTFKGRGGHGSMPWDAKDPVTGLIETLAALQSYIAKHFDALDPIILNVGWIRAGNDATTNIVPETASFGATVRSFSKKGYDDTRTKIPAFIKSMAAAFELEVSIEFSPSTKVLINHAEAVDRVEAVVGEIFGPDKFEVMPQPIPGGEDFASIVEEIPGAFVFLSAGDPNATNESRFGNHSNKAIFDEAALSDGVTLLTALAFDALNRA